MGNYVEHTPSGTPRKLKPSIEKPDNEKLRRDVSKYENAGVPCERMMIFWLRVDEIFSMSKFSCQQAYDSQISANKSSHSLDTKLFNPLVPNGIPAVRRTFGRIIKLLLFLHNRPVHSIWQFGGRGHPTWKFRDGGPSTWQFTPYPAVQGLHQLQDGGPTTKYVKHMFDYERFGFYS